MERCACACRRRSLRCHDGEWGVPERDDWALYGSPHARRRAGRAVVVDHPAEARGLPPCVCRIRPGGGSALRPGSHRGAPAGAGIVRNRLKVESAVENAGRVLEVQEELGSFSALLWDFVDGEPLVGGWTTLAELPAETPVSKAMSKELKRRGFRFVDPRSATPSCRQPLVNDHVVSCFRYRELTAVIERALVQEQVPRHLAVACIVSSEYGYRKRSSLARANAT